jgi:hypothetical protein
MTWKLSHSPITKKKKYKIEPSAEKNNNGNRVPGM